jgi:hypothetical protein
MSRKVPSFGQLIEYMSDIDKSDEQYNVYQNIYARNSEDIEQEFKQNADAMFKRKNGVYLYHEILSITKSKNLEDKKQKEILRNIAYEYAQKRAAHNLIFATLHDDHDEHLHYHFIISANALGESKKTRMSKAQFDKFKKNLEARTLKQYPELEQKIIINKQAGEKLSNKGSEQKRRTGKTPQRDLLKEKLQTILAQADSKQAFLDALDKDNYEVYVRGKTIGILDKANNRKHRLKTLGILEDFEAMSARIQLDEAANKQQEKANQKAEKTKTDNPDSRAKSKQSKTEADTQTETAKNQSEENQDNEPLSEADKIKSAHQEEIKNIRKQQSDGNSQTNKDSKK